MPLDPASADAPVVVPTLARPNGRGITIVGNPASGSAEEVTVWSGERLPVARLHMLSETEDLEARLRASVEEGVLAVSGGDGSIGLAASIAQETGATLAVVPGGTLNHFARDLGVAGLDDAADAIEAGTAREVDLARISGRTFVNTASFGAYADMVDIRERLEGRLGKWLALLVAAARILARAEITPVEIDGERHDVRMAFIGNCMYDPPGLPPTSRRRLNDGAFDVRLVVGRGRMIGFRILVSMIFGRLTSSPHYIERRVQRLNVACAEPIRLAADGETFDGGRAFVIEKSGTIRVYAKAPSEPEVGRDMRAKI